MIITPGFISPFNIGARIGRGEPSTLLNGLVAYYKFDQTSGLVIDSIAGNDGTNVGPTRGVTGKIGNAFLFDGVNDLVTVPNSAAIETLTDGDFTIAAWVKHSVTTPVSTQRIASKRLTALPSEGWLFHISAVGVLGASVINSGTNASATTTTNLLDNSFHQVMFEYTQSTRNCTLYVDAVDETTSQVSGTADPSGDSDNSLNIGSSFNLSANQFFDGVIDEMPIWSRALTADERTELFNSGAGKTLPF